MTIEDVKSLREQQARFIYNRYEVEMNNEDSLIRYYFELIYNEQKVEFVHKVEFNNMTLNIEVPIIDHMVFSLGLMEVINYYKLVSPKAIEINCGRLSEEQLKFWKKLYYLGLGEYRYLNDFCLEVSEKDFVTFECKGSKVFSKSSIETTGNIIPVGGGKDSATVLGMLSSLKDETACLMVNAYQCAIDCIEVAGYESENIYYVNRIFDKQMIRMNQEGFLNGHIPYSAILAFISLLVGAVKGKRYIILSNENSANEATVIGTDINHQYSKTLEFELDFRNYVEEFITEDIVYFSLLRPWTELKIARKFSEYTQFHETFLSCNKGLKINQWCGECGKCLFVYIILSPFIETEALVKIFNKNLLEDESLLETLKELIGVNKHKPFDCVGTVGEVVYSLEVLLQKSEKNQQDLPILLEKYKEDYRHQVVVEEGLFENASTDSVPEEFVKYILD